MDFYSNGDVAPGGRFTFVFDTTATGEEIKNAETPDVSAFLQRLMDFYADLRKFFNYIFH